MVVAGWLGSPCWRLLRARGDGFRGGPVTAEIDYIHPNRKMPITIKGVPRPDHSLRRRPIRKGDSRL